MKKVIFVILLVIISISVFYIWKNMNEIPIATGKEDLIRVRIPKANQLIKSPLIIKGEARGVWYFEASFPIKLIDEVGNEVGHAIAQAQSDWMTEDFVPFEARLEFSNPTTKKGTLIFKKDNPSGLPEKDDELRVPVRF